MSTTILHHPPQPELWGWSDANPKKSAAQKLREGAARFSRKFGKPARFCLCHPDNAAAIGSDCDGIAVNGSTWIGRHDFHIGNPDVWHLRDIPETYIDPEDRHDVA